jgi:hypothetical protein
MQSINANLLDFALRVSGATDALFDLALLNGVGITDDVPLGTQVQVPDKTYEVKPVVIQAPAPAFELQLMQQRQTVADFTCQHCGTMEALFLLAELNGISVTENVAPGTELKAIPTENKIIAFYANSILDIVTEDIDRVKPGGIGYMQIQNDFIVS